MKNPTILNNFNQINPEAVGYSSHDVDLDRLASYPALQQGWLQGFDEKSGGYLQNVRTRDSEFLNTDDVPRLAAWLKKGGWVPFFIQENFYAQTYYYRSDNTNNPVCLSVNIQYQGRLNVEAVIEARSFSWWKDRPVFYPEKPQVTTGDTFIIANQGNGPQITRFKSNMGLPFQSSNYNPKIVEAFSKVCKALTCKNPHGRLSIFDGPAGTGKTTLLQNFLYACHAEANFVYIPAHMVPSLGDPTIIPVLSHFKASSGDKKVVLLLEDADECLKKRTDENIGAVSSLLNFTDGFLGKGLDLRILATTNESVQLDPACERPGRLFLRCPVTALNPEVASNLCWKLLGEIPESKLKDNSALRPQGAATLAEVYDWAHKIGWEAPENEDNQENQEKPSGFSVDLEKAREILVGTTKAPSYSGSYTSI